MRTILVELLDEIVKLPLLLKTVETRRACRFFFEREMHPFVASILLRMTRPDPFNADTETKPPDRKAAEIEQRITGGERYARRCQNAAIAAPAGVEGVTASHRDC
jgi:hypothetical protein